MAKQILHNMKRIFVAACILSMCTVFSAKAQKVSSPDGKNMIEFSLLKGGVPSYEVFRNGKKLIAHSILGMKEKTGVNLANHFKVKETLRKTADISWRQPWGENKQMREHYNEMAVKIANEGASFILRFRAFDDGIGFRYECFADGRDSLFITDELTQFCFAKDGESWSIPANFDTYELLYKEQPISAIKTANTPMTFKTSDGIYGSIHEAALYDFPEMTLKQTEGCSFKSDLAPWPDGIKAHKANRFTTAWRTIQMGDKAVDLINSSLILNLNPPCKIEDTSWIEPMKYVGIWWGMHVGIQSWVMGDRHGATTENTKKYIDFAAANNIRGVLIEGWNEGWQNWGGNQHFDYTRPFADFNINELVRYAAEKGITLIGHHETGGNVPYYESQMEKAIKWYKQLGINYLKTGYAGGFPNGLHHHGQYGVRHYQKLLELAAANKMTVDAHEPIKDTGIRRTWPNMMTREGARGMEWNAWSEGNPPSHHETLPFTRFLGGPMDYTPGTFDILLESSKHSPLHKKWNDQDKGNSRVNTTLCKQLADWVIFYSPMQMASDMIENYESHPAFQFFRDYDVDCDWSKAIAGEPGKFIVIVRGAKEKVFLGATTNEETRQIPIKLDFLETGCTYRAIIYADAPDADWKTNPTAYTITEKRVNANDTLNLVLAKGGGEAITFVKVNAY